MSINQTLSSFIDVSQFKSLYDIQSRNLISNKMILAVILSLCSDIFGNMDISDIIRCIEADPAVGSVSISGELIRGRTNDISFMNEGRNTFDILFDVYVSNENKTEKRIINVEIQNDPSPGYSLETRAEFYLARMLSMQYGREIRYMDYSGLKKVSSIWINTCPPKHLTNTVYMKKMTPKFIKGKSQSTRHEELMTMYMINLGEEDKCTGRLRLLAVLLSNKLSAKEKKEILEKEYEMKLERKAEEEVNEMCNLADAIEKRGIEKGMQKGMQKGQLHVLMVLLQEKLGELTKETTKNIMTASQENLEELIHHFMTIQSEEDILKILKKV